MRNLNIQSLYWFGEPQYNSTCIWKKEASTVTGACVHNAYLHPCPWVCPAPWSHHSPRRAVSMHTYYWAYHTQTTLHSTSFLLTGNLSRNTTRNWNVLYSIGNFFHKNQRLSHLSPFSHIRNTLFSSDPSCFIKRLSIMIWHLPAALKHYVFITT